LRGGRHTWPWLESHGNPFVTEIQVFPSTYFNIVRSLTMIILMSHLIVLRGPTRAGKSSIATEFCNQLGFRNLDIDGLADELRSETHAANLSYEDILREAYEKLAACFNKGSSVVLQEAFAQEHVDVLTSIVIGPLKQRFDTETIVFFICCPLSLALERNRQSGQPLKEDVVRDQHNRFPETDNFGYKIDTSSVNPKEAVDIIKKQLGL